ncbi:MAG: GTP cyclohydrolase FolE2, partial [Desulfobacterales bacterium]
MKDIQNQPDYRNIPIDKVGIKNLRYPITVRDRRDGFQHTVASINMFVDLPHDYKGTHMSRFVEMLHLLSPDVSLQKYAAILDNMKKHLNAASAHLEMTFPYFIEKKAPVSTSPGLMDYTCSFVGSSDPNGKVDLVSSVVVPISSVCPCSMEISDNGAHNQRGEVRLSTRFKKFIWMEDMIELVEESASSDVYSVLKRVDEKSVTERAFANPKFVEDIVRDV